MRNREDVWFSLRDSPFLQIIESTNVSGSLSQGECGSGTSAMVASPSLYRYHPDVPVLCCGFVLSVRGVFVDGGGEQDQVSHASLHPLPVAGGTEGNALFP